MERFSGTGAGFALVRDLIVESVRPDWHLQRRDPDATVVYVSEVLEHFVLSVAARLQVRRSHTDHFAGRDVAEVLEYLAHTNHLADPFLVAFVLQAFLKSEKRTIRSAKRYISTLARLQSTISYSRDRFRRDLVAVVRQALDHVVVAVLVRDKERASQRAVVRIQAILSKYLLIVIEIVVIYRTIERHYYHLRRLESLKMLHLRSFSDTFRKP